jgi:adenylate cyclase
VLWLVASRADREVPGWRLVGAAGDAFGEALVDLRLRPLGPDDGERLVANLLAIDSLPAATRAMILARAEGNPLFVEEIVRMLIDRKAIEFRDGRWFATARVVDVEIPDTLHGLLLARIDRLPSEARRVLRVASVIGRTFPVSVLDRVVGGPS